MKRLYDLAKGKPLLAKATIAPADENDTVELVAAVANKAIIPVWFLFYNTGDQTSETHTLLLWKGSKYYIRQMEYNPAIVGKFFKRFDFTAHGGDMGTGAVNIKSNTVNSYTQYAVMGYYLLDV